MIKLELLNLLNIKIFVFFKNSKISDLTVIKFKNFLILINFKISFKL